MRPSIIDAVIYRVPCCSHLSRDFIQVIHRNTIKTNHIISLVRCVITEQKDNLRNDCLSYIFAVYIIVLSFCLTNNHTYFIFKLHIAVWSKVTSRLIERVYFVVVMRNTLAVVCQSNYGTKVFSGTNCLVLTGFRWQRSNELIRLNSRQLLVVFSIL